MKMHSGKKKVNSQVVSLAVSGFVRKKKRLNQIRNKPTTPPNSDFDALCMEKSMKLSRNLEKRIEEKGGRDVKLVMTKKITKTDMSKHHGRLLIPRKKMREGIGFLTEEEEIILARKEKGKNEIPATVIEPCGAESMILAKWLMEKSEPYCLRKGWNAILERNSDWKVNQIIHLWSFRVGHKLCFAIDTSTSGGPSTSSSDPSLAGKKQVNKQESRLKLVSLALSEIVPKKKRSNRMRYKATTYNSDFNDEKQVEEAAIGLMLLSNSDFNDEKQVEEAAIGLMLLSKGLVQLGHSLEANGFAKKEPLHSCASVSKNHIFECSEIDKGILMNSMAMI